MRPKSASGGAAATFFFGLLIIHQVEHRLDHPRGGENLPVVGDALFGLDQVHRSMHFGRRFLVIITGYLLGSALSEASAAVILTCWHGWPRSTLSCSRIESGERVPAEGFDGKWGGR